LNNQSRLFFVAAWLLLLAGCSSAPTHPPVVSNTPNAQPPVIMPPETAPQAATPEAAPPLGAMPQPLGEVIPAEPVVPKTEMSSNKAIIALLDRAELDNKAGKREAAGASLERALRIEPRNAWLWHELAQLRLTQGQYAQAITLARKSTSFSGHEYRVQAMNWRVIGNARVAQGDSAGADEAFKRATELERSAQLEKIPGF
jgi:predicted Zn-dependent protease